MLTAQDTQYRRYDIWFAELSNSSNGSVQKGRRPVLIIQNDIGNRYSPTVQVASVTTAKKKGMPTHVNLDATECGLRTDSIAMMEQVSTISKDQLMWRIGSVPEEYVPMLDRAGMIQFGYVNAW
ncbi:type II toxin-antitoxin system PemK/MazF family toxin [Paenibacillus sp. SZ31]|uniref:type II toxin-antitoxin system PemK/MazF family toxin n=1 Tax=Paenibacillus sp. SZ31 TaxID=2725555 RepID=UPI00146B19E3|nr:type II toxin-antitoxin system PemK/MazF family toxin [Paenibacillus sp. SZ31]NMI04802.1 type II toxin-antitoxin system PemK/MazF family toxin [Paenibacillus sp. SZ31]